MNRYMGRRGFAGKPNVTRYVSIIMMGSVNHLSNKCKHLLLLFA